MNLEQTAASLAGQYGTEFDRSVTGWEKFFNAIGKFGFGGFCAVVVVGIIGLIYTIITRFILSGNNPIVGTLLALFIVFAALTLSWVIFNESKKDNKTSLPNPLSLPPELDSANTSRLTDGAHIPAPTSVTENTTNLLPTKNKTGEL